MGLEGCAAKVGALKHKSEARLGRAPPAECKLYGSCTFRFYQIFLVCC